MSLFALTLALVPVQEPASLELDVLGRLEVPDFEAFLTQMPPAPGIEELLALPDRPMADRQWSDQVRLAPWIVSIRSVGGPDKAAAKLTERVLEIEEALGVEHPLLLEAGVALDAELLRSSLSKAERKRLREADGLAMRARFAFKRGDFAQASELFVQAIDSTLAFFAPASATVASLCDEAAKSALALGEFTSAQTWTVAAIHLYSELYGMDHPAMAEAVSQLGHLRLDRGDRVWAERLYLRAFQLLAENYGPRGVAAWRAGNGLGTVYQELGRLQDARKVWEAGNFALDSIPPREVAAHLDNLSVVLRELGERELAEEYCRRGLAIRRELYGAEGHLELAVNLHNLSAIVEVRGDLAEAEALAREDLAIREKVLGPTDPATLRSMGALGTLLQRRGDTEGALEHLNRAVVGLRASTHARRETNLALQLRNLASVLIDARRGEEARAAAQEALELYRKHYGPDHLLAGQCHSSLGIAALLDGRVEDARRSILEALRIARASLGETHHEVALALERLAHLDGRAGDAVSARTRLVEALEIARLSLPGSPLEARLLAELGRLDVERGELALAGRYLSHAFELTDRRRTNLLGDERARALFSARLEHREISRLLAWVCAVEGKGPESFDVLARGRDRVMSDLLARASSDGDLDRPAPYLARALENEVRARSRAHTLMNRFDPETSVSLAQLVAAQQEVEAAEQTTASLLRERWPATRAATWEEVRSSLGPGERLCSFGWTPHGLLLLTLAPELDGVEVHRLASGHAEVSRLAREVAFVSRAWARGDLSDDAVRAAETFLAGTLFPPAVRAQLLGAERLILVPDGPLNALPFEALPVGPRGERWVDVGPELLFATSAGLFRDRRERARAVSREALPSVVAVGDPSANTQAIEASARRDALPGSSREASRIGARFRAAGGEALVLLGEEATLSRVREGARQATHLHLGCHGIAASAEDPFLAGLDLADGAWSLAELLREDVGLLQRARLVVLAACESRRGSRLGDQEVALPWGFLAAGAPAVLTSLWRVDDRATALLMDRFYGNVLSGRRENPTAGSAAEKSQPMPVGAALREAKRWLKGRTPAENRRAIRELGLDAEGTGSGMSRGESGGPPGPTDDAQAVAAPFDYSHPRYWAAFQIVGVPD